MSINDRATHVMSAMLAVVVATNAAAWTVAGGTQHACTRQHHKCTPSASLTCCLAQTPIPADPVRVPHVVPPISTSPSAALMDIPDSSSTGELSSSSITSAHWLRVLDLGILHHSFLI